MITLEEATLKVLEKIKELILKKKEEIIVIAIDGRAGAGKSTFAGYLSGILNCDLIKMDHFFLPLNLRTKSRLEEIGGNVHYERFIEQVLKNIKAKKNFSYDVFDCSKMEYLDKKEIILEKFVIVEGTYSTHPKFDKYYDVGIFMDVNKNLQQERLLEREGKEQFKNFQKKWIPMEESFFKVNFEKNNFNYIFFLNDYDKKS